MDDEPADLLSADDVDFTSRSGFFRPGPGTDVAALRVGDGPRWTVEEADARAHAFLAALVGDRRTEAVSDPLEYARQNSLLLLFGADERAVFETLLARMPRARAEEWRELLSGGASSAAFGPLTLQEQLDERQVEQAMVLGRRQRIVNLVLGSAIAAVVLIAAISAFRELTGDDTRPGATLRFEPVAEETAGVVAGGPPVPLAELTASLDTPVALAAGEGPAEDRVVTAPFGALPQPPGALRASIFAFDGVGQVAVVGPEGWLNDPVCLRASVVSADLRALDTVHWESAPGACVEPVGQLVSPPCVGDDAVSLPLAIPSGAVELPEGGTAFADAIRVQAVGRPDAEFELLSVRGVVAVPEGADLTIPAFGGAPGDEVTFDLGADRRGTCVIGG